MEPFLGDGCRQPGLWVGQENRAESQDPDAAESPVMREQGSAQPREGAGAMTPTRASGGAPRAPVPRGPFIWNPFRATRQKRLEDPADPSRQGLGPLSAASPSRPGLGITEEHCPTGWALLSTTPA